MLKKLELDTLKAEVSSLDVLIEERKTGDPIGLKQYIKRKEKLLAKIEELKNETSCIASVGLFFGGNPVFGSRGIDTHFATSIIDKFQSIISKRFSFLENGALASRGPIKNNNNTKLMITDVARGSFGFILEESPYNNGVSLEGVNSELKYVVEDVTHLLSKLASDDMDIYNEAFEDLDNRTLIDVRSFYDELFTSKATLKIVDENHESIFSYAKISNARNRMEQVNISEERIIKRNGKLFLLPSEKKFEILLNEHDSIKGKVSKSFFDKNENHIDKIVGHDLEAVLIVRDIYIDDSLVNTKYILDDIE